ncbi:MAG TPA: methyltransferase [Pyrinomonadaceae bacterium]|jgi:SAM-dependent methyltransferase
MASSQKEFDQYAEDYDLHLEQAISVSGESKDYFARGRVLWLSRLLDRWRTRVESVLDFGCGTGSATPHLFEILKVESLLGLDVSPRSVSIARRTYGSERARFLLFEEYEPAAALDLVVANNVFHHIAPEERAESLDLILKSLKPGGLLAFWEQNAWNPATRYVMSRCEFDQDAVLLSPVEARRRLRLAGFELLRTDFLFIFPRALGWLRFLEPLFCKLPFGTQYMVLCRKP